MLTEVKQADVFVPVGGREAEGGKTGLLSLKPVPL